MSLVWLAKHSSAQHWTTACSLLALSFLILAWSHRSLTDTLRAEWSGQSDLLLTSAVNVQSKKSTQKEPSKWNSSFITHPEESRTAKKCDFTSVYLHKHVYTKIETVIPLATDIRQPLIVTTEFENDLHWKLWNPQPLWILICSNLSPVELKVLRLLRFRLRTVEADGSAFSASWFKAGQYNCVHVLRPGVPFPSLASITLSLHYGVLPVSRGRVENMV